jgi:subtilisin family serine protease
MLGVAAGDGFGIAPNRVVLAQQATANAPQSVPGELIVQYRRPVLAANTRVDALGTIGALRVSAIGPEADGLDLIRTSLPLEEAIAALERLPEVEFAEPNWIVQHYATSNDPEYTNGTLWGMYGNSTTPTNQFGSQAGEAWARGFTGSSGVYIGVIDEGIYVTHQDLAPNIWTNPFDPVNGVDDDGNGYIDDINGWDFAANDNSVYDGNPGNLDIDSHGTHVAGTIGARGGNGIGVAGVVWNVTMISGKFLGAGGGSIAAGIAAVKYFTDLKVRHGLNIVATSNSWGCQGAPCYSQALHIAIIQAAKQNILFVAAAGNGGPDFIGDDNDVVPNYPSNYATDVAVGSESAASYDAVIAVANITTTGGIASSSNFGDVTVDIGAPGSAIMSTYPQNTYESISGTSMATPHVSGAVALYKSMNPAASPQEIRNAILTQGLPTASLAGRTVTGRRLNVGDFTGGPVPTLSISDVSVSEGNIGTKSAVFTASLSFASAGSVSVNYATADGTAISGSSTTASNPAAIAIPDGNASPYPSTIMVPAGVGSISNLKVVLQGLSHTFPSDIDVLLVGPTGQTVVLLSDAGGSTGVSNVTLTFDDGGASLTGQVATGTFRPTNLGSTETFSPPAPAGPYGSTLSAFNGTNAQGTWQLFVVDDEGFDTGLIASGWSLIISSSVGADYVPASGTLTIPAGATSGNIVVSINGDLLPEPSETFTVTLSTPGGATIADGTGVGTITNDDVAFTDHPLISGVTPAKAIHILELRIAVNASRAARGLGTVTFTDPALAAGQPMRAVHIAELRAALPPGCAPAFTDPVLVPGVTPLRAAHVMEIRLALLACP